jgi:cytosine deaminase
MSLDLILRNGHIVAMAADAPPADIGIKDGYIVAIEPGLAAEGEELDLGGRMVSLGLV